MVKHVTTTRSQSEILSSCNKWSECDLLSGLWFFNSHRSNECSCRCWQKNVDITFDLYKLKLFLFQFSVIGRRITHFNVGHSF